MDPSGRLEIGLLEECGKLGFRALAATQKHQHVEIDQLSRARGIVGRNHHLHQKHPPVRPKGALAIGQNTNSAFIIPIVNDVFENVDVRAGGDFLEEIAPDQLAAIDQPFTLNDWFGRFDDVR